MKRVFLIGAVALLAGCGSGSGGSSATTTRSTVPATMTAVATTTTTTAAATTTPTTTSTTTTTIALTTTTEQVSRETVLALTRCIDAASRFGLGSLGVAERDVTDIQSAEDLCKEAGTQLDVDSPGPSSTSLITITWAAQTNSLLNTMK